MPQAAIFQSKASILSTFGAYLPKENHSLLEIVGDRVRLDESEIKIATIYGSKEELVRNVTYFRTFPGNHMFFESEITEPLTASVIGYKSLKHNHYLYRQDLLKTIEESVCFAHRSTNGVVLPIISFYLRVKENEMKGICEIAPHYQRVIDDWERSLKVKVGKLSDYKIKLKRKTPQEVFEKFEEMLPKHEKDPKYSSILDIINKCKRKKVHKYVAYYEKWINICALVIEEVEKFMQDHPDWFQLKPKMYNSESQANIRLFEDGKQKFVLARELLAELTRMQIDLGTAGDEMTKMPELMTMDFKEVFGKLGNHMKAIEFVIVPIPRTQHRAVPIPFIDNRYMISATDLFLEILQDLITFKNIFQNLEKSERDSILELIYTTFDRVIEKLENCRFVFWSEAEKIKNDFMEELQEKFPKLLSRPKLEVYKIDVNGFDREHLDNELHRLGLTKTFPTILEYSNSVFERVESSKQKEVLRSCDMHRALEHCQIICVLGGKPDAITFFHNFGTCHRLWIGCPECQQIGKPEKKPKNRKDDVEVLIQQKIAQLNFQEECKKHPADKFDTYKVYTYSS